MTAEDESILRSKTYQNESEKSIISAHACASETEGHRLTVIAVKSHPSFRC